MAKSKKEKKLVEKEKVEKMEDQVEPKTEEVEEVTESKEEETTDETDDKPKVVVKAPVKSKKKAKVKSRSYLAAKEQVDSNKRYNLETAIELAKKTSFTKFDGTIEIHVKTTMKKGQDLLRGMVTLPSGSPKQPNVVIADEAIIDKIKSGKIEFDILIATPALMPKLAQVAKILGPKGIMPSPKSGTVTEDPEQAKKDILSGKVEYKSDPLGNIHIGIGKCSWSDDKLIANYNAITTAISQNRLGGITLNATMGPSIRIR